MSEPIIIAENLSKLYQIGLGAELKNQTFREAASRLIGSPFRWIRDRATGAAGGRKKLEDFWALQDVSFKVEPGEVLGVVGRNGAGKSTLLKVLSRITRPTSGRAEVRGRVGSLLEVGTGFHPELTGRENIYLNGTILGMSRKEIARKFDEIVAFSEVEKFLDTPVKRYSSGMYTRLGFAVASHLDPEILIVDEVLSVGDAQFQKKCLDKMEQVRKEGRTILFVSHAMSAVKALCTRALLMENGRVTFDGEVEGITNKYLDVGSTMKRDGTLPANFPRQSDVPDEARVISVRLLDLDGFETHQLYFGQPFEVVVELDIQKDIEDGHLEVSFSTRDGTQVTYSSITDGGHDPVYLKRGRHEIVVRFDTVLLPRDYGVNVGIHHHRNGATSDYVERCLDFTVIRMAESGKDHYHWSITRGMVRAHAQWTFDGEPIEEAGVRMAVAGIPDIV